VAAAHQRLDQVRADETLGPRHRNLVHHNLSSPGEMFR
jgi:hypothetical protein